MQHPFTLSRRAILTLPLALAACKGRNPLIELTGATMGTTYNVVAVDPSGDVTAEAVHAQIERVLADANAALSNWDPASEVSRFNAATSTEIIAASPSFLEVMEAANAVFDASGGRFDVTLGPLIELWGFGAAGSPSATPSDTAIADALAARAATIEVSADGLRKSDPQTQVYLSAIGKGHGVDLIGRALEEMGLRDFMVEVGGDLYTAGLNPDGVPWRIGVETPDLRNPGVQSIVEVSGLGLATSGDYRNYFEQDGTRYSHILDPMTGRPITHTTASATVLAENAMLADAWATAMLILGREAGLEIARAREMAVLFIERDTTASDLQFTASASPRFEALQA
ncbi:MAG: FAD:protein FMN transferase [Pseudomonadota bacterium]